MKNEKKWTPHLIAVTAFVIFIVLGLACANRPATQDSASENISYPMLGSSNNANIAIKDYRTVGIVFVNSQEVYDSNGEHTGSKITYEMFMREAAKLGADDVINIKIDANHKVEKGKDGSKSKTVTTFTYTGTGLAIKYTDAVSSSSSNRSSDLTNTDSNSDSSTGSNISRRFPF
jgi:uncharacterized protein YbjQ (UPF0145 family)